MKQGPAGTKTYICMKPAETGQAVGDSLPQARTMFARTYIEALLANPVAADAIW